MNITTEELARIRAVIEADMDSTGGKTWDKAVTPEVVIALCDALEQNRRRCRGGTGSKEKMASISR